MPSSLLRPFAPLALLGACLSFAQVPALATPATWPWPLPPAEQLASAQQKLSTLTARCGAAPNARCPLQLAEARAAWMAVLALGGQRAEVERESLTLLEQIPAEAAQDPRWTALLDDLATGLEAVEMLGVASDLRERSLTLTLARTGPESRETLKALMLAADVARNIDAGKRSRPHAADALALAEALEGTGSALAAEARALHGSVWQGVNFPLSAMVALEDGIQVLVRERGDAHPSVAVARIHVAQIAGQSRDAELFDASIDAAIASLQATGSRPDLLAFALYSRGYERAARRDSSDAPEVLTAARQDIDEALALLRANATPRPYTLALATHALAELTLMAGDVEGSVDLRMGSLELFDASVGIDHPQALNMQISLEWTLSHLGRHDEALAMARRVFEAHQALGGPGNWGLGTKARALALVAAYAGDEETAREAVKIALEVHTRRGLRAPQGLDERRALDWMRIGRQSVDLALTILRRPEDDRGLWEILVQWTGAVRNAAMSRHWARLASPEGAEQARRLGEVRAELAAAVAANDGPARISSLAEERDRLERTISLTVPGLLPDLEAVGVDEICAMLQPGESMVHFIAYRAIDPFRESPLTSRRDALVAFVATGPDCVTLRRVELGAPDRLARAGQAWREALQAAAEGSGSRAMLEQLGAELRALSWDPLVPALGDSSRVYIVPDGPLTLVPFAALPDGHGGYLLDRWELTYLDTGRDVALPSRLSAQTGHGALVVGDVDYDGVRPANRASPPASSPCATAQFSSLPGTAREIRQISRRLNHAEIPVLRLTGSEASAARFNASAPGRRVLHIAAHGYAPREGCAEAAQGLAPLALSGLALAGANLPQHLDTNADDGLLSAEEISGLDLRDTELVVLSACGSALGTPWSGEGVLGLRRAFAVAGARALVGALGPVDDQATITLIDELYERYLAGRSPSAALAEAQRSVLAAQRRAGRVRVEDWGLFVSSGG